MSNPLTSLYTTLELSACKPAGGHPDGDTWLCDGLEGYPVRLAMGDQRTFVSIGSDADKHRSASQTLAPFNSVFSEQSTRATLEWRFVRRNGRSVPYATILRYYTSRDRQKGEVLVVTRVAAGQSCHVAYIDALANPGAIASARKAADSLARTFDCQREPEIKRGNGTSPM